MAEKTPVSLLQELCIQEGSSVPIYDEVPDEDDSKNFTYIVHAFGKCGKGTGRSKREAKHKASEHLINFLRQTGQFPDKLKQVPHAPRSTSEKDSVGTLLDICVQRNWPIAKFEVQQASGQPHAPQFTVVCCLSSIKRSGSFSTKKGAKQLAAEAMLNVVQELSSIHDADKLIAPVDYEPPDKVYRTYRELKKSDIKPKIFNLSNRHKYFMKLPEEDRQAAEQILEGKSGAFSGHSDRDILDLALKALKIEYEVDDIPDHLFKHKVLIMKGDIDSVHIGHPDAIYKRVISFLKTMITPNLDLPRYTIPTA